MYARQAKERAVTLALGAVYFVAFVVAVPPSSPLLRAADGGRSRSHRSHGKRANWPSASGVEFGEVPKGGTGDVCTRAVSLAFRLYSLSAALFHQYRSSHAYTETPARQGSQDSCQRPRAV